MDGTDGARARASQHTPTDTVVRLIAAELSTSLPEISTMTYEHDRGHGTGHMNCSYARTMLTGVID